MIRFRADVKSDSSAKRSQRADCAQAAPRTGAIASDLQPKSEDDRYSSFLAARGWKLRLGGAVDARLRSVVQVSVATDYASEFGILERTKGAEDFVTEHERAGCFPHCVTIAQ